MCILNSNKITKYVYFARKTLCVCLLNYEFANIFACVHVCQLIFMDPENNASDWGLKPRNQCCVSHHAEAIMWTSRQNSPAFAQTSRKHKHRRVWESLRLQETDMASENSETNVAGKWQEEGIVSKVKWERVQMRQEKIVEWVVAGGRREEGGWGTRRGKRAWESDWDGASRVVRRLSQVKETRPLSLFTRPISRAHPARLSP